MQLKYFTRQNVAVYAVKQVIQTITNSIHNDSYLGCLKPVLEFFTNDIPLDCYLIENDR